MENVQFTESCFGAWGSGCSGGFGKQLGRDTIPTQTFANDNAGLGREKFEK